jgi:hypothetical protein
MVNGRLPTEGGTGAAAEHWEFEFAPFRRATPSDSHTPPRRPGHAEAA